MGIEKLYDKDDKPTLNEISTRRWFYEGTVKAPKKTDPPTFNSILNSTFLEEHIQKMGQEQDDYLIYSYGLGSIHWFGWKEDKKRDEYLEKGLESFDIYED